MKRSNIQEMLRIQRREQSELKDFLSLQYKFKNRTATKSEILRYTQLKRKLHR